MLRVTVFFLSVVVILCSSDDEFLTSSSTQALLSKCYNSSYLLSVPSLLRDYEYSKNTHSQEYSTLQYLNLLGIETPLTKKSRLEIDESVSDLSYTALFEDYIVANRQDIDEHVINVIIITATMFQTLQKSVQITHFSSSSFSTLTIS
jgi:hypothetical protein